MRTFYFYSNASDDMCYCATLYIFQQLEPGERFVQLECINIQASKHPNEYHELIYRADSITQSGLITECRTYQEIVRYMRHGKIFPFLLIQENQYYRIKRKLLQICSTYPAVPSKPLSNSNHCQH